MSSSADEWQARLEEHFGSLAARRREGSSVFALEHGLNAADLAELHRVAAGVTATSLGTRTHWLPLVVHATEVAYEYEGDEYWQSFRDETPGWYDSPGSRNDVRQAFRRFASEFRGPTPQGRWAAWFSIICWPIANAILPTDLQRQLARALFVAGPGLGLYMDDIESLGQFVAASGWQGSDRFQQLREQPLLLGQIALALLRPQAADDGLLLDSTLRRIAADLESERSAASWLRSARGAIQRPNVRFAGSRIGVDRGSPADLEAAVERAAQLTSPEVFLRFDVARQKWAAWLELPNLSPLANVSPVVRESLLASRSWVPGADTPISRGRLLFDGQEIRLTRWPPHDAPLIRFQGLAAGLETALLRAWIGPPLPAVFRVLTDGTARRVVSRVVRPGQSYLVAYDSPPAALRERPNESDTDGVFVSSVTVPGLVSPEIATALRQLGCLPSQTATMWPAGSVPVAWDGEGSVEWLTTDSPMLGLSADHDLHEVTFSLDGQSSTAARGLRAGDTTFVELPGLQVGAHELVVRELPVDGPAVSRNLSVRIREPVRLSSTAGPIRAWTEPYSTDLQQLWSGSTAICVAGPDHRTTLTFRLSNRPAGQPSVVVPIPVTVPLSAAQWRTLLSDRLQSDRRVTAAFDGARWARVEIDADRFGVHALEFERALPPLRWALGRADDGYSLTLHDDGEGDIPPEVLLAPFAQPDTLELVPSPRFDGELLPHPGGGLYIGRRGGDLAVIVVPPRDRVFHSFEALRYDARIGPAPTDLVGLRRSLDLLSMWSRAALPGNWLALDWRTRALTSMHRAVMERLCGRRWLDREANVRRERTAASLQTLSVELSSPSRITDDHIRAIVARALDVRGWSVERRIELFRPLMSSAGLFAPQAWSPVVRRRGGQAPEWAAEFYLRLATNPDVASWSGSSTGDGVALAMAWPLPLRAARFLLLGGLINAVGLPESPDLLGGWTWE